MQTLSAQIRYQFKDINLLKLALTHRSKATNNNERLEFIGDSILNFVIAAKLYSKFKEAREGELTRMRAQLVRGETLAQIARELNLGDYLNLGLGELKSGGHARCSILADALEALIGALYLDAGLAHVEVLLESWYATRIEELRPLNFQKDAKTRLQEYLQRKGLDLPTYHIDELLGETHNQHFRVACICALAPTPVFAEGASRRKAEQAAAEIILGQLTDE